MLMRHAPDHLTRLSSLSATPGRAMRRRGALPGRAAWAAGLALLLSLLAGSAGGAWVAQAAPVAQSSVAVPGAPMRASVARSSFAGAGQALLPARTLEVGGIRPSPSLAGGPGRTGLS